MRNFEDVKRIVIKVGTNVLAPNAVPDSGRIKAIADDVAAIRERGYSPILVSSGAIGFGTQLLGMSSRPAKVELRQACAAVGQPVLMRHWQEALAEHNVIAAQILLSRDTFDIRRSFLNLKNAVESLLELKAVPVLNENDCVSTAEIGDIFGDNDSLSAHIASKLDAGLLILLTDIDALYDKDPRNNADARLIPVVERVSDSIRKYAGKAGSEHATGGMSTKLKAVEIAARAGCRTVLADGRVPGNISAIIDGQSVGTIFLAGQRMGARSRWILAARTRGEIQVDEGALNALGRRKSLLPSGVTGVSGIFSSGDVVLIGKRYNAIASMSSEEIKSVQGRHSREVKKILGPGRREEVARVEDIVDGRDR